MCGSSKFSQGGGVGGPASDQGWSNKFTIAKINILENRGWGSGPPVPPPPLDPPMRKTPVIRKDVYFNITGRGSVSTPYASGRPSRPAHFDH